MDELSVIDRRLLAQLKLNSRASITTLAGRLNVSRATVQSHMERMVATGVIRKFTVELDPMKTLDAIRAVMLVELKGNLARNVIRIMRAMPEVVSLHTTNGAWDLVAQIEVTSLPEFDLVLRKVREISGVLNSETCLLLDTAKD